MRTAIALVTIAALALGGAVLAQEEPEREAQPAPAPNTDLDQEFAEDAAKADNPRVYGYRRSAVFPQSLFSGEHLRPYERRGDVKEFALMGTFSFDARAGYLMRASDRSRNAWNMFGRLRFGPAGLDARYTQFSNEDKSGPTSQTLEKVFSLRLSADLDLSHHIVIRPILGWTSLDHDPDARDDDAMCWGAELEVYPLRPLTLNVGYVACQSSKLGGTLHDMWASVGILPLLFGEDYPEFHPDIRVGIRRLVGKNDSIASTGITIEIGIGF